MSEAQTSVTALSEVMRDVHGSEETLRAKYAEYLPTVETDKKARRYPINPERVKTKAEYDPNVHEAEFEKVASEGGLLHGSDRPPVIIAKERPEHRFLVFLYSQGMSTKDIYIQLGGEWDSVRNAPISGTGQYSYQHLHTIRRQAWFQKQLIAYMEECGKDVIRAKLETELMPSLDKVISIRDDEDAPKALQLKAAESLIDRFLGKPVQSIVVPPSSSVNRYEDEADALQKEAEKIEQEIKSLNPAFLLNNS